MEPEENVHTKHMENEISHLYTVVLSAGEAYIQNYCVYFLRVFLCEMTIIQRCINEVKTQYFHFLLCPYLCLVVRMFAYSRNMVVWLCT